VEIPSTTFDFWRSRVDALHGRGYLLLPHRREFRQAFGGDGSRIAWDVLADCHRPLCRIETETFVDEEGAGEGAREADLLDHTYVQPANPYTAVSLLTCAQFEEYLHGVQWDYGCAANPSSRPRRCCPIGATRGPAR